MIHLKCILICLITIIEFRSFANENTSVENEYTVDLNRKKISTDLETPNEPNDIWKKIKARNYLPPISTPKQGLQNRLKMGPGVGGGGDVLLSDNNSFELADSFEVLASFRESAEIINFNELPNLINLSNQLQEAISAIRGFKSPSFINPNVNYFKVDAIPEDLEICQNVMTYKIKTDSKNKIFKIACTDQNDTYIVFKLFEKLSSEEQILLLLHEEFRRLNLSNGLIAQTTTNLRSVIKIYLDQYNNNFNKLSSIEIKKIKDFLHNLIQIGYYYEEQNHTDKNSLLANFINKYDFTDYGGLIQKGIPPLLADQKIGIFSIYENNNFEPPQTKYFTLMSSNICDSNHECLIHEYSKTKGNIIRNSLDSSSKVPILNLFNSDWGIINSNTQMVDFSISIQDAQFAYLGFVIFKRTNKTRFEILEKGTLNNGKINKITKKIQVEKNSEYVIRIQGTLHQLPYELIKQESKPIQITFNLIDNDTNMVMQSGKVSFPINNRYGWINSNIYFK